MLARPLRKYLQSSHTVLGFGGGILTAILPCMPSYPLVSFDIETKVYLERRVYYLLQGIVADRIIAQGIIQSFTYIHRSYVSSIYKYCTIYYSQMSDIQPVYLLHRENRRVLVRLYVS